MGVTVFCDPPTSGGADFLSELMTQHLLERARGSATPPPLSHSHLQLVQFSTGSSENLCRTHNFFFTIKTSEKDPPNNIIEETSLYKVRFVLPHTRFYIAKVSLSERFSCW